MIPGTPECRSRILLPKLAGGVSAILEHADSLIVLCGSTLEAIAHLHHVLPDILAGRRGRRLLVVPTGSLGYSADDIARTLEVDVAPPLPEDRAAAAALANQRRMRRLEKTPLLTWAAALIAELAIDAPAPGASPSGECTPPVVLDQPTRPHDEAVVGAGRRGEARR